jgi:GntR family transcriptional regulator/MocR family aminotransferase
MDLFLDAAAGRGLSAQLYDQIRGAIAAGRLRPGDQLPPSRHLAQQLRLSRYTVTTAYGRLTAEGFVEGRAGGGSIVAHVPAPAPQPAQRRAVLAPSHRLAGWTPEPGPLAASNCRFDLRAGSPDPALFPARAWRRRLAAAAGTAAPPTGDPAGEAELRKAIARWIGRSRSVIADEATVIVTSGAQHAIDLVARVLLEPGDTVAVEDPGYRPVVALLRSLGASVISVPVDREGMVVDQLPDAARMVYLTPSHQYPLGVVMSMTRRRELLAWAARNNAALIEDDYDSEFRYFDRPLEPIQRLAGGGPVIYLGSFSKTLSPALRLGFAVLPPALAGAVAALRQLIDWHPPVTAQLALAGFINDGLLDKHLRRTRRVYAQRHQILQAALSGPLSPALTPVTSSAGLHITALLRNGHRENRVRDAAAEHGIATTGLSPYYHARPAEAGLVIGFGTIDETDLPAAIQALQHVLATECSLWTGTTSRTGPALGAPNWEATRARSPGHPPISLRHGT